MQRPSAAAPTRHPPYRSPASHMKPHRSASLAVNAAPRRRARAAEAPRQHLRAAFCDPKEHLIYNKFGGWSALAHHHAVHQAIAGAGWRCSAPRPAGSRAGAAATKWLSGSPARRPPDRSPALAHRCGGSPVRRKHCDGTCAQQLRNKQSTTNGGKSRGQYGGRLAQQRRAIEGGRPGETQVYCVNWRTDNCTSSLPCCSS